MRHIVAGMCHLEKEGILHRDLALRNLLVTVVHQGTDKYFIKVSGTHKKDQEHTKERGKRIGEEGE